MSSISPVHVPCPFPRNAATAWRAFVSHAWRRLAALAFLAVVVQPAAAGCWVPEFEEGWVWACASPTATWATPASGAVVTVGVPITLSAVAALGAEDAVSNLKKVDFYQGSTLIGTVTATGSSYTASISWTPPASGAYTFSVRATDNGGQPGPGNTYTTNGLTGPASSRSIRANALPTASLTAPASGTVVAGPSGSITLTASAADSDGSVSRVEFLSGGAVIAAVTSSPYTYTWSGVPAGTYSITARAVDNDGALGATSAAASVRVNALPAATVAASPAQATAPATFSLTASASDADGSISQVDWLANGTVIGSKTAAPYSLSWSGVAAGSYAITARATDNNGQQTTSAATTVTSNQAPSISLGAPANGAVFNGPSGSITLSATASDSDGSVSKVEFLSGGSVIATVTAAPYQFTWGGVAAGTYTLSARVTDNLGAVTSSGAASVRVNALPTASVAASPTLVAAPGTFNLSATASDPDGSVAKVEFLANGSVVGTVTSAPYSYTWSSVAAGSYSITARATDNNGQQTTSSAVSTTSNAQPVVTLTAPANGAVVNGPSGSITLTATASDSDGSVAKVEFLSGSSVIATVTAAPYQFTWAGVAAGTYTLSAKVTDNLGAVTSSSAASVRVNALPTASVAASPTLVAAPGTFSLSATAFDPDGSVVKVEFLANGSVVGTVTSAPYNYTWSSVAAGSYTITARATDSNGQQTTSSAVSATSNALPVVALTAPATGAVVNGPSGSITLTATASDSDGSVAKVEFLSGSSVIATVTAAPYQFTWAGVAAGTYALSARVTDNLGAVITSGAASVRVNALPTASVAASPTLVAAPGTFNLSATATDPDGSVAKVEFLANGSVVGTVTTAPYNYTWSSVAAGNYAITARATDNNGQQTTSSAVTATSNAQPAVTLTAPANGAVVNGPSASLTLTAIASDSDGSIAKVEFLSGSSVIGTVTAAPYQFTWANVSAGNYTLSARVTDNLGAAAASSATSLRVNAVPTVSLAANPATATAPGTFGMSASAADADGSITKVEFLANGTLLATSTTAPYTYAWNNVPAGSYALVARATDNNGQQTSSAAVNVVAKANVLPAVSLTAPAAGTVVNGPSAAITLSANAADSDGSVTKVEFLSDGTVIGTVTAAPYQFTWADVPAGTYALSARAIDSNSGTSSTAAASVRVNALPSVTLTPSASTATAPGTFTFTANAADSDGSIAKLEFLSGDTVIATKTAPPYTHTWSGVAVGGYAITARVTDNNAQQAESVPVRLTVSTAPAGTNPPVVTVTAPAAGSTFTYPATITLRATATDPNGTVAAVHFYAGTAWLGKATLQGNEYVLAWTGEVPGTYSITARALDNSTTTGLSSPVSISIVGAAPVDGTPGSDTATAGSLPGDLAVSASGAATYSVPLSLPPGTAGVVPVLGFHYSSQAAEGLLGHGWSLGGFSSITRCGLNRATDNPAKPYAASLGSANSTRVNLDASDQFCLDGQRLVLVSGTHGANAEYRTEIDSFSKVLSFGSDPARGPERWEVWTKPGLVIDYGSSADSKLETQDRSPSVALAWATSRVRDRRHNYYTVAYLKNEARGEQYPSEIRYTGNSSTAGGFNPYHAVRLVYDPAERPDPAEGFVAGAPVGLHKRLNAVQVVLDTAADGSGGSAVREYRIQYQRNPVNGRSLVRSLQDCTRAPADAADAWKCLPASTFDYSQRTEADQHFDAPGSGAWGGPEMRLTTDERTKASEWGTAWGKIGGRAAFADFNGDGRTDVASAYGEGTWRVCLSTGSSFNCQTWTAPGTSEDAVVADINGDGAADLVIPSTEAATSGAATGTWTLCLSTRSGFGCGPWTGPLRVAVTVADLNADGRDDLVVSGYQGGPVDHACLSNGTAFNCTPFAANGGYLPTGLSCDTSEWGDPDSCSWSVEGQFDGTGRSGRFVVNGNRSTGEAMHSYCTLNESGMSCAPVQSAVAGTFSFVNPKGPQTAFINTDGADAYSDIVLNYAGALLGTETCTTAGGVLAVCTADRGPAQAQLCRGTGKGFSCSVLPQPTRPSDYSFETIADIDGDGRPDGLSGLRVCQLGREGSRCDAYSTGWWPQQVAGTRFADFDGDGRLDRAGIDLSNDSWTVMLAGGTVPDLLVKVTNGVGQQTEVRYDSLRNPAVYTPDTGATYPLRDVQDGTPVVVEVQRDNGLGNGGSNGTTYTYGGAKVDVSGRGSLGFRWFEALDQATQVKTRTEVSQSFPTVGMPTLITQVHLPTGVEMRRSSQELDAKVTANASGDNPKVWLPYVKASSATVREINTGAVVSTASVSGVVVNNYGDETARTETTQAGDQSFSETRALSYQNDEANWLLGRPTRVVLTRTAPGYADVTRQRDMTYTALGELETETLEAGDTTGAFKRTTTFIRGNEATGVVTGQQVAWQEPAINSTWPEDGTARTRTTETLTYDAYSRFVLTTKNALNHSETKEYDPRTGQLTLLTGPNGLSTRWQMDGFGRVTRETRADGTYTTKRYTACQSNCGVARLQVTTQSFNAANAALVPPVTTDLDALGRGIRRKSIAFDGRERITEAQYDAKGRLDRKARTRFTADAPVWTNYTYDDLGRSTGVTGPRGTATVAYAGLQTVMTNEKGQQRTEVRNALGKLRTLTNAKGKSIHYEYEPFGNLAQVTDAQGNQIKLSYDKLGRKTQLNDPDLGTWTYVLNALGELRSQTDAKGQTTQQRYDALGRMQTRLGPDQNANWTYDTSPMGIGQLAEAYTLTGTGTKDYQRLHNYDALGRPQRTTERLDIDYVSENSYDANGRVSRSSYKRFPKGGDSGAGIDVDYAYNANGYLRQVTQGGTALWTVDKQDALDRVTRQTYGNGIVTRRDYREDDARLVDIVAGPAGSEGEPDGTVQNDVYLYDTLGNLSYRAQIQAGGALLQESFGYDELNRMTSSEVIGQGSRSYAYDDIGNITSKHGVGSFTYPTSGAGSVRPHAVSAITGTVAGIANPGFSYDANGNLNSGLGRTITWSGFNMPLQVDKAAGAGPGSAGTGSASHRFIYGPELQRTKQTITVVGGPNPGITTFWYGGAQEKETRSADNSTQLRIVLPQGVVLIDRYSGANADVTAGGSVRQVRYYQKDRLGSTVAVTDEAGQVLERQYYDPWGKRRNADGSDSDTLNSLDHRFGYTGQEHMDASELVHMNGRVYDPILGRFMSADPTIPDPEDDQNFNRYTYVLNNPTGYTDPSGFAQMREAEMVGGRSGAMGGLLGGLGMLGLSGEAMAGGLIPSFGAVDQVLEKVTVYGSKCAYCLPDQVADLWDYLQRSSLARDAATKRLMRLARKASPQLGKLLVKNGARMVFAAAVPGAGPVVEVVLIADTLYSGAVIIIEAIKEENEEQAGDKENLDAGAKAPAPEQGASEATDEEEWGSYTNTHESGKTYHGKGGKERSQDSGKEKEKKYGDRHVATDWTPAENEREAFKDEARRLEQDGGHRSSTNYNQRASPGSKYIKMDGK